MSFSGFADAQGKFFKALAKHNDRDWFLEHKAEFEEGWNKPMKALLDGVKGAIDGAYAHVDLDVPKVFRIFRDVRFSKDKSPFKTHIGGFLPVARSGKGTTDLPMALYFHVGHDDRFGAAGHYQMAAESLARFRSAVSAPAGKELPKILHQLSKKEFAPHLHDSLKRVPKGFDPDHPRAELLKAKGLVLRFPPIPEGILTSPKLTAWLARQSKTAAPLVEWLVFATA